MSETSNPTLTEDEVLAFTQAKRLQLVNHLTPEGKSPNDPKEQLTLLSALSDMDRAALASKRLVTDAKNGDTMRQATAIIGKVFGVLGNENPFEVKAEVADNAYRHLEHPDVLLENVLPAPGELDIGIETMDYDNFMAGRQS